MTVAYGRIVNAHAEFLILHTQDQTRRLNSNSAQSVSFFVARAAVCVMEVESSLDVLIMLTVGLPSWQERCRANWRHNRSSGAGGSRSCNGGRQRHQGTSLLQEVYVWIQPILAQRRREGFVLIVDSNKSVKCREGFVRREGSS